MTRELPGVVAIWMIAVTLALFFLPLVNGVLGGFVGGVRASSAREAVADALFPLVPVSIGLWIVLGPLDAPVMAAFDPASIGVLILLADAGLLTGAAVGGLVGSRRSHSLHSL